MSVEQAQTNTYRPSLGQRVFNWFSPRGHGLGMLAFALNRITGIGLVLYLAMHLVVLSLLIGGEESWDAFVNLARSPLVLIMDVVLIAGFLIHGLNGVRVALVGMGISVRSQKPLFIGLMVVAALVLVYAAVRVFTA